LIENTTKKEKIIIMLRNKIISKVKTKLHIGQKLADGCGDLSP